MAEIKLDAETRTEFGKGAARRLRRDQKVPAVMYGHGTDPVHIALPAHATLLALREANALLDIQLPGGESELALPKQVQRNPIRDEIEHVDLVIVKRGEKVVVEVPVVLLGEVAEGMVNQDRTFVNIKAEATNIPRELEFDISKLQIGTQITLGDLVLPEGSELEDPADDLLLSVQAARAEEVAAPVEAEEAAEGEEAAAE
jgi:large subunit ribosomal protein L25